MREKSSLLKIIAFTVLSVFILSIGINSFAALPEVDSINWSYLNTCSCYLEKSASYADYDCIYYEGSTTTGTAYKAYVYVEVQQLKNGSWQYFASVVDEDVGSALAYDEIPVEPGYTYQLKIVHRAKNKTTGAILETHTHYSSNYVVSLPR